MNRTDCSTPAPQPASATSGEVAPLPPLSTDKALPPYQSGSHAFSCIEGPIGRALKFASVLKLLAEVHDENGTDEFKADVVKSLVFLADETFAAVDDIDTLWLHFHNASADQSFAKLAQAAQEAAR